MPAIDLRGIKLGEYKNNDGTVTYETPISMGEAMTAQLELTFAEGRLYSESRLAEYIKLATGGTVSIGVKYIPDAAQKLMYGASEKTRTLNGSNNAKSLLSTTKDIAKYVGMGFYAPDMIDGVNKFTAVFVYKVLFGPPSRAFKTKDNTITFQTPTTTGEFLGDDSENNNLFEVATLDSEADAKSWISLCFGTTI